MCIFKFLVIEKMALELHIQNHLRNNGDLESLKSSPYNLKIKKHYKYPNLLLFKYDQIASDFSNQIVQEARGLILDSENNWNVVSFPYKKFFNYGEPNCHDIDWPSAKIYEKLDGSLMTMYYYNNEWQVSSSGLPDAQGLVRCLLAKNIETITFEELFWRVFKECNYDKLMDSLDINVCYIFELMTPHNRVVVKHKMNSLVLHGLRNIKTFQEYEPTENHGFNIVSKYDFNDINIALEQSKQLNPYEHEGFIVCDQHFNRLKIKSPEYVTLSLMAGSLNKNPEMQIIKIIQTNEGHEFLLHNDELRDTYDTWNTKYEELIKIINSTWLQVNHIANQKDFAFAVQKLNVWFKSVLFLLKNSKIKCPREFVATMNTKELIDKLLTTI